MPAAALRALIERSIDYAGLFPPASLPVDPALRNHARYIRDPDEWMLGTFVLPLGKFGEASENLAQFDVEHRLRLSALGPKTDTPAEFIAALERAAEGIRNFHLRYGAAASVTQIEMALPAQPGATVSEAAAALAGLAIPSFWEATADEAERAIAVIAEHNRGPGAAAFGFKLRTGGVMASAFPSSIQIARALVAAAQHRVSVKFTAGLHHPIRQFHSSIQTTMHGFLNVLGAGVLAAEHQWDAVQTAAMLEDEDASAFQFDDEVFRWREWEISTAQITARRELVTSLGSCSFDEPRDDLRALHLF